MNKIRWAIVGTGYIANEFAKGMQEVKDAKIEAVVSRNRAKGEDFAHRYHCGKAYTDFQEMLDHAEPDVVYIAVPNDCHYSYIMEALEKGVSVLSEKPMADNLRQLDAVLKKAAEKDVFLMEGMWTRCFPAVREARRWAETGRIGKILTVKASFDIRPAMEDWQPWKGGIRHAAGALRDVGIYSLAMANMVFPQEPEKVSSAMKSNGEVDESFRMLLNYGNGQAALLGGAFNQIGNPEAEIIGELGRITIGPEFWHPTTAALTLNDGRTERYMETYPASGFQFEIRSVQKCIRNGEKQCPHYTWDEMKQIAGLIETTRKSWGIYYEADKEGK